MCPQANMTSLETDVENKAKEKKNNKVSLQLSPLTSPWDRQSDLPRGTQPTQC